MSRKLVRDDGLAELLDDFALAALKGILANPQVDLQPGKLGELAVRAWQQAAVMMEVREKAAPDILRKIRHSREFFEPREPATTTP